jgi:hypothetical protein
MLISGFGCLRTVTGGVGLLKNALYLITAEWVKLINTLAKWHSLKLTYYL